MLKNDYSIIVETMEDTLSKINLFGMITDTKEISDNICYIVQNIDSYIVFVEDPEEAETMRQTLENIGIQFEDIRHELQASTFSLLCLIDKMVFLTDEEKKELLESVNHDPEN
ncbi:MAG: hypothetical protein IKE36_00695 [Solobacterium sp.]|nr:hypothetical protein [Solobacterium sp.]